MTNPIALVTLAEASAHLRRDHSFDDPALQSLIYAASARVIAFVTTIGMAAFRDPANPTTYLPAYVDANGDFLAPPEMKHATLVLIGYLNANPGSDADNEFTDGNLPRPVRAMLRTLRLPVLA